MKQIFLILVFFSAVLNGLAQNISKERAVKVASNFLFNADHRAISCTSFENKDIASIYVVNFSPEGWALVSANKNAKPVIGYSYTGFFDNKTLSSNVKDWLDFQSDQISNVKPNTEWAEDWETLDKHSLPALKSASEVEPLITAEWNQDNGWNKFCPYFKDGPDEKAYVGCVAVAMAQALYYLKFPERPTGSKTYGNVSLNFDNEPAYNWSQMSATSPDDYNARLLYNCAVAVEMDFGSDGSGAYTERVPFALQHYFGFTPAVKSIQRYTDDNEWIALLKSELNKNHVLIYSGNPKNGGEGHAFNIDGYNTNNYFHFNWGWGGPLNGYFTINNIAPGIDDFTKDQKVVIGISLPYWGPTDIALSNQTIKEKMPAGTVVGDLSITDYSKNDQFTLEVFGAKLFMQDGYAPAKFYAENMQLKSLEPLTAGAYPEIATIRVTDSDGNKFEKRFEIVVDKATSSELISESKLLIYPNPTNNTLYIKGANKLKSYKILNSSGNTVSLSENVNSNDIEVSRLQNGVYFLELFDNSGNKSTQKFVIQR